MTQYYFLGAALPPIVFGSPQDLTFEELVVLLEENLTEEDKRLVTVLRRLDDILNFRAFWKGEPLSPYGTLDAKQVEEALLERTHIPDYVDAFLDRYKEKKERLDHFAELIGTYFREEEKRAHGFVREYLAFERQLRLVLAALRVKKYQMEFLKILEFEDPAETFIAEMLAQKDAPEYEPPERFSSVKHLFQEFEQDPLALHQAFCRYRAEAVEEMAGIQVFSIDAILGYMIRLIMALKWLELDAKKGIEKVDLIIEERA